MQMPKPTEADKDRFRSLVPDDPRVEIKPMFGNLGAFVNGTMFMGLFGPDIGLRLAADDLTQLRAEGAGPFGPSERPMGGWLTLPSSFIGDGRAADWISRAMTYAATLPPKPTKR